MSQRPEPCEHADLEHFPAQPDCPDEPGCTESWRCRFCGEWVEIDEATKSGI